MYDLWLTGAETKYDYEELIKVFLKPSEYNIFIKSGEAPEKKEGMRKLYEELANLTGKKPPWGTLTGVRPVKLAGEMIERLKDAEKVRKILADEYLVDPVKADLLISVYRYQREVLKKPEKDTAGVYIGIPFCPTRCLYCSFTSNRAPGSKINDYLGALFSEMEFTGAEMKKYGVKPETVFIGGGTPTSLEPEGLLRLLDKTGECFDMSELKEFTVEAGRPDTITPEKLKMLKRAGVTRLCVNPQSMREETLSLIGRSHSQDDIKKAFYEARAAGFGIINMDIIAGLPEERTRDFMDTVDEIVRLGPENITVHTLAVKRASRLIDMESDYHYKRGEIVKEMLAAGNERLYGEGYKPYYLYRQKNMAGGLENVGWCKEGAAGIYNIRIMEEEQTVIALGAGGITKVYYPGENRLERIPNVANYEIYIARIDEMIKRKKEKLFTEGKGNVDKRA